MSTSEWITFASIPVFTGAIGWIINWSGVLMLFNPVQYHGRRVLGMRALAEFLPHKLQEIPGIAQGGLGWQGIIPMRAAKMGSIAVDKAIAKLGTPGEFYQQLEPDKIAEHIVQMFSPQIPELVDETMRREHPQLWADVPPRGKQAVYARVQQQLPSIVRQVTDEIGVHIDQLLDPKLMVIDHFEKHPDVVNRIFRDIGERELKLMINFGFYFGFLLGIPVAILDHTLHQWWLLPILGVIVGWITNLLGMSLIFEPVRPRKIGPFTIHGLFLRRQDEAAEVYARIIAADVITLENIGDFLLNGPRGDRTRKMLADAMGPAIDGAAGPIKGAVRVALGPSKYDAIRAAVAQDAVGKTMQPFTDPEFSRRQSEKIRVLIEARTKELPPEDFVEMMRAAIKEDEWMLYAHGAILGLAGGFLHLAIFGVSGG
ncbi:hypothetical protein [Paraconexibacter algicola]|uniref:hypothetical protein n=1 Tax=Paraconexibacter algicola TaxID=2133960 RepID=UPI0018EE4D60|nr:hypothetical protein [Paraconexibacter algicola]